MRPTVDPVRVHEIPKPGGGLRLVAQLSARDARIWQRLAGQVARAIEPRLDPRVLANRAAFDGPHWSFAPLGAALQRARLAAAALAGGGPLLRTDVEAFYPSVSPGTLAAALVRTGAEPADARSAAEMVEGWGNEGYAGLPVGPPGSAVLANAVLAEVDRDIAGFRFLRWVDDYLIALPGGGPPGPLLERLDHALGAIGLARSEAKTSVTFDALWPGTRARENYG